MTRICWLQAGAEGGLPERGRCLETLQEAEAIWPSSASYWQTDARNPASTRGTENVNLG